MKTIAPMQDRWRIGRRVEALVMKKAIALTLTAIWIGLLLTSATSVIEGQVLARNSESPYAVECGTGQNRWKLTQETRPGAPRVVTMSGRISESRAKKILAKRSREVLLAIKNQDGATLATFVHPRKGVRFSLYGYVFVGADRVFTRNRIKDLFASNRRYVWGCEDGSGNPIRLTARQYIKRYVCNRDFLRVKEIGYNKMLLGGDATTNIGEVYPDAIPVTYYYPGSDPNVPGYGWESLCLAFEKKDGTWYLIGVITSFQTI